MIKSVHVDYAISELPEEVRVSIERSDNNSAVLDRRRADLGASPLINKFK